MPQTRIKTRPAREYIYQSLLADKSIYSPLQLIATKFTHTTVRENETLISITFFAPTFAHNRGLMEMGSKP